MENKCMPMLTSVTSLNGIATPKLVQVIGVATHTSPSLIKVETVQACEAENGV